MHGFLIVTDLECSLTVRKESVAVVAVTMPTVPAKLLLRHESQAHASSAAMLSLEPDEREIRRQTDKWPSVKHWSFTSDCDQMLLKSNDQHGCIVAAAPSFAGIFCKTRFLHFPECGIAIFSNCYGLTVI